jgi:hypothetical protein
VCKSIPPPHQPPASLSVSPSGLQTIPSHPTRSVADASAPVQTDAKYKGSIYPAPWVQIKELPPAPRHVCHFGDESLLAFLAKEAEQAQSKPAAEMVRGIVSRSEYRLIFTLDYEAASGAGGPRKFIDDLREGADSGRKRMEERLRALVNRSDIQAEVPILLYCPNIRMQAKEVAAHVELTPNKVVPLSLEGEDQQVAEEIRVLNGKYQRLWRLYIFAHPKLVFPQDDSRRLSLLSTIVDTFCSHFGVPDRARDRGSRYKFISFQERVEARIRDWRAFPGVAFKIDDMLEAQIREAALDLRLWKAFLPHEAPLPVTDAEYRNGFNYAILIRAADAASLAQRDKWPERLKPVKGSEWYTPSSVPIDEEARTTGFDKLRTIASSIESGASAIAKAADWPSFIDLVAKAVTSAGDSLKIEGPPTDGRIFEVVTLIKGHLRRQVDEETLTERVSLAFGSHQPLSVEQFESFKTRLQESIQESVSLRRQDSQYRDDDKSPVKNIDELLENVFKAVLSPPPDEPALLWNVKK